MTAIPALPTPTLDPHASNLEFIAVLEAEMVARVRHCQARA